MHNSQNAQELSLSGAILCDGETPALINLGKGTPECVESLAFSLDRHGYGIFKSSASW